MPTQLNLGLTAVAFISPQNHPILVRALSGSSEDLLKYHYLAHTSLDVIDERRKSTATVTPHRLSLPQASQCYSNADLSAQSPRKPKHQPRATSASCTRSKKSPYTATSRLSS
jgi:hypothetical protein